MIKEYTKDELILNTAYHNREEFYNVIILLTPTRKPQYISTVEKHVKYLEIHRIERFKEKIFTSLEAFNDETQKIIADIIRREFQKKLLPEWLHTLGMTSHKGNHCQVISILLMTTNTF